MKALLISLAWSGVVAAGLYGVLRGVQYVLFPEANPATVVWSAHAGYFWRMWIAAYAGGAAGFVAYVLARRDLDRTARALLPALTIAAVVLVAQGVLLP